MMQRMSVKNKINMMISLLFAFFLLWSFSLGIRSSIETIFSFSIPHHLFQSKSIPWQVKPSCKEIKNQRRAAKGAKVKTTARNSCRYFFRTTSSAA
jgi:hypothetical protein